MCQHILKYNHTREPKLNKQRYIHKLSDSVCTVLAVVAENSLFILHYKFHAVCNNQTKFFNKIKMIEIL